MDKVLERYNIHLNVYTYSIYIKISFSIFYLEGLLSCLLKFFQYSLLSLNFFQRYCWPIFNLFLIIILLNFNQFLPSYPTSSLLFFFSLFMYLFIFFLFCIFALFVFPFLFFPNLFIFFFFSVFHFDFFVFFPTLYFFPFIFVFLFSFFPFDFFSFDFVNNIMAFLLCITLFLSFSFDFVNNIMPSLIFSFLCIFYSRGSILINSLSKFFL